MLCWQQDSLHLTGPGIYPQVYHRTPCPVELICKGSLIKNKGRIGLFKISQKERLFYLLYNQMLLGIISQCGPTSCALPRKVFLSPSVWARRGYIRKINWKERIYSENQLKGEFTDLFWKLPGCSLFSLTR